MLAWTEGDSSARYPFWRWKASTDELQFRILVQERYGYGRQAIACYHVQWLDRPSMDNGFALARRFWSGPSWFATLEDAKAAAETWLQQLW